MIECAGMECRAEVANAGFVCDDCWATRVIYRDELYDLWRTAWLLLPPAKRPPDFASHKQSVPGSSVPLDLSVLEIQDRTLAVLVEWADIVRDQRGLHSLRRDRDTMTLFAQSVVWLKGRDYVLHETALAGDYLTALFRSHRDLRRVVRGNGGRIDGACIQCGRAALLTRDDHVVCLTCGSRWLQAAYLVRTHRDVSNR
jgi:hypothetical protein